MNPMDNKNTVPFTRDGTNNKNIFFSNEQEHTATNSPLNSDSFVDYKG